MRSAWPRRKLSGRQKNVCRVSAPAQSNDIVAPGGIGAGGSGAGWHAQGATAARPRARRRRVRTHARACVWVRVGAARTPPPPEHWSALAHALGSSGGLPTLWAASRAPAWWPRSLGVDREPRDGGTGTGFEWPSGTPRASNAAGGASAHASATSEDPNAANAAKVVVLRAAVDTHKTTACVFLGRKLSSLTLGWLYPRTGFRLDRPSGLL